MKNNFIHVCFIIDCSGSMATSKEDVEGGFQKVIDEQKENVKKTGGSCAISLYTFETVTHRVFIGKNVDEVRPFNFRVGGLTAMNDGIGRAIDEIGQWLNNMDESERPEKNLIVIITDGLENASDEYTFDQVKDMIKHQETKYSWEFIYLGTDITDASQGNKLGIKNQAYTTRGKFGNSFNSINTITSCYLNTVGDSALKASSLKSSMDSSLRGMNAEYLADTGNDMVSQINK